ncbi:MAG: hypothetical protein QOC85_1150 [Streptomyces sp.]|jgi:hypothetical protein|nr:hypothetical protein [Streptomyces sp.]
MGIRVIPRRTATATPLVAAATALVSALLSPVPVFAAGASTARTPAPCRTPREHRPVARAALDPQEAASEEEQVAQPEPVRLRKSRLTCVFASVRQEDPAEARTTLFGQAALCRVQEWHHRLTGWERARLRTLAGGSDHGAARRLWTDLSHSCHSYLGRILTRAGSATEAGSAGGCPA